jgi:hypothetical protein
VPPIQDIDATTFDVRFAGTTRQKNVRAMIDEADCLRSSHGFRSTNAAGSVLAQRRCGSQIRLCVRVVSLAIEAAPSDWDSNFETMLRAAERGPPALKASLWRPNHWKFHRAECIMFGADQGEKIAQCRRQALRSAPD